MSSYEHIRRARAFGNTRKFWNPHQTTSFFAPPIIGLTGAAVVKLRQRATIVMDLGTAELAVFCVVVSYVVCWILSFIFNYVWSSPAALNREQQAVVEEHIRTIEQFRSAAIEPPVSRRELETRQFINDQLVNARAGEINVLKCVLDHGEIVRYQLEDAILDSTSVSGALERWRHKLIVEHVEPGTNRTLYSIMPALKSAVEYVLHSLLK